MTRPSSAVEKPEPTPEEAWIAEQLAAAPQVLTQQQAHVISRALTATASASTA